MLNLDDPRQRKPGRPVRRRSLLVAGLGGLSAALPHQAASASPQAGDVPPPGLGKTRDGREMSLADHAGKVVAVFFWAAWCPYCRKEMPVLEGIQRKVSPDQLSVIAVNTEASTEFRELARQLSSFKMQLTSDADGKVRKAYALDDTVPKLFIIGRDGLVQAVYNGYDDSILSKLVADFNTALAAPRPTAKAASDAQ